MARLEAEKQKAWLVGVNALGQTLLPVFAPILGWSQFVVDAKTFYNFLGCFQWKIGEPTIVDDNFAKAHFALFALLEEVKQLGVR